MLSGPLSVSLQLNSASNADNIPVFTLYDDLGNSIGASDNTYQGVSSALPFFSRNISSSYDATRPNFVRSTKAQNYGLIDDGTNPFVSRWTNYNGNWYNYDNNKYRQDNVVLANTNFYQ